MSDDNYRLMNKIYIGIDNGVSGSVAVVGIKQPFQIPTPVINQLNYTKKKQNLNRLDGVKLTEILKPFQSLDVFIALERPLTSKNFKAVVSAMRCLEATLIVIELLRLPYQYFDSREWQSVMLPSGLEKDALKKASLQVGKRLFPKVDFTGMKDADGILLAEYCRRKGL